MRTHEFKKVVRQVVTSKPAGYRYTDDPKSVRTRAERGKTADACYYRHFDGTPGCIVGAVVAIVAPGVTLTEDKVAREAIELAPELKGVFTERQIDLLMTLQGHQDTGGTWDNAYHTAFDKEVER